jgi:hypothetical protein
MSATLTPTTRTTNAVKLIGAVQSFWNLKRDAEQVTRYDTGIVTRGDTQKVEDLAEWLADPANTPDWRSVGVDLGQPADLEAENGQELLLLVIAAFRQISAETINGEPNYIGQLMNRVNYP